MVNRLKAASILTFSNDFCLSRLISADFEDASDSSSEELLHGWTINTKYYTADVSVCVAHLHDRFSISTLPIYTRLAALVMVFNMNDLSSLVALQNWVTHNDVQKFEILLSLTQYTKVFIVRA
ncbi:hypothetical protein TorRG33x02_090760 [Trema orientale]|uniref:Uncharacterized protein n=1 Tax=Trema orientale TaxID=63057 RepID=A0A2P5FBN8_TREOI|nr:hypothetical protein TorRG33x02_090760 [Trema orientale]